MWPLFTYFLMVVCSLLHICLSMLELRTAFQNPVWSHCLIGFANRSYRWEIRSCEERTSVRRISALSPFSLLPSPVFWWCQEVSGSLPPFQLVQGRSASSTSPSSTPSGSTDPCFVLLSLEMITNFWVPSHYILCFSNIIILM